jgi:general secretion pathway protein G
MLFNETRSEKREASREKRGFTLIEIMIVVVILGLLAGVAVYSYPRFLDRAKRQKARADLSVISGGLEAFYGDKHRYPVNQEGLKVLAPEYVKTVPNDPWGRPYQYIQPGRNGLSFEVITYGADGREGGNGTDADLSTANLNAEGAPRR